MDLTQRKDTNDCSPVWKSFKDNYLSQLSDFDVETFPRQKIEACLIEKALKPIDQDVLRPALGAAIARELVTDATDYYFMYYLAPKIPDYFHGDTADLFNNWYLNTSYPYKADDETRISTDENQELFFTHEYLCQDPNLTAKVRMRNAIDVAKNIELDLRYKTATLLRQFSDYVALTDRDMSEDVDEKFADLNSEKVMNLLFKKLNSDEERQSAFFYNIVTYCSVRGSSFDEKYPDLSAAQKSISSEPHSIDNIRLKQFLNYPGLRETLGCEKDFDMPECTEN